MKTHTEELIKEISEEMSEEYRKAFSKLTKEMLIDRLRVSDTRYTIGQLDNDKLRATNRSLIVAFITSLICYVAIILICTFAK